MSFPPFTSPLSAWGVTSELESYPTLVGSEWEDAVRRWVPEALFLFRAGQFLFLFLGSEVESGWRSLAGARVSGSPEDLMPRSLPYNLPSILQAGDGPPQMRPYHTIIEITEHK